MAYPKRRVRTLALSIVGSTVLGLASLAVTACDDGGPLEEAVEEVEDEAEDAGEELEDELDDHT